VPAGQFGGEVSSLNAIPNWAAFLGPNQVAQVLQNSETLGDAGIDILGPTWSFGGIIEGQYTVVLQPGIDPSVENSFISASISQTGLVPAGTQSLQFKGAISTGFSVDVGGQDLTMVALGTGANYTIYGVNIPSSLVGQNEALTLTALAGPNSTDFIDSFVFSPNAVPEPSTWALLLGGAGAIGLHGWKRKA
jgi:hypothetical protein